MNPCNLFSAGVAQGFEKIKPENHLGRQDSRDRAPQSAGSSEKIIVAVKAGREISRNGLAWALTHVVRPGGVITLLAVFSDEGRGRKLWRFPRFAGDCASGHRKARLDSSPERKCQISESCSQMMLQFHGVYDESKVNVKIKIVSASPTGAVAAEAKKAGANWIVLDKQLKTEVKRCLEELQCNIVVMKGSQAKVLKLHLLGSQKPEGSVPLPNTPVEELCEKKTQSRLKHSTPISSPEEMATPFTRTTEAWTSMSSSNDMASPFTIFETNHHSGVRQKGESSFREEVGDSDNALTVFETESEGSSFGSQRWSDARQELAYTELFASLSPYSSRSIDDHRDQWIHVDEQRSVFSSYTKQEKAKHRNPIEKRPNSVYNSGVREAVSLSSSLRVPPPLCSICQHKAPAFGKPPRWFSYAELEDATDGFSEANFLAEGGFGSVHRGVLEDGLVVAVKQHKLASSQGDVEFCSEVEVLSCAQHRNVVMLIGFCIEEKRRLLVYEYICNGSLDSHLYGSNRPPLGWHARRKIAIGAARGLRYLHEDCRVGCIIHRDLRPNNILITHDYEPMVGDFGLARWQPDGGLGVHTRVIGTFGYLAPEYAQSGQITEKADVYAFGVVLVELISGRKAIDLSRPKGEQCLTEWARPLLEYHCIDQLLDPRLDLELRFYGHQLHCMVHAASICLRRDPQSRPKMSQVLQILEGTTMADLTNNGGLSSIDTENVGSRSGRMDGPSPRSLGVDSSPAKPMRLSLEALKAVYCDRGGRPQSEIY
ncbi:unnamed protein product [Victoria cruziana]